jgi:hypothetical protein
MTRDQYITEVERMMAFYKKQFILEMDKIATQLIADGVPDTEAYDIAGDRAFGAMKFRPYPR